MTATSKLRGIVVYWSVFGGPRPGKDPQGSVAQGRDHRAAQIPDLETLSVWSDGQRSQYKGFQGAPKASSLAIGRTVMVH